MNKPDQNESTSFARARKTMSGIDYMRKLVAGEMVPSPMSRLLNFQLVDIDEGRAVVQAEPSVDHENGLGIAHGGLAATLLDTALGCAVNSVMPAGKIFTTLEMKINFTRPMTAETGPVTCTATLVHIGGRTATAEGRIVDADGRLYAHGTATCILFRE